MKKRMEGPAPKTGPMERIDQLEQAMTGILEILRRQEALLRSVSRLTDAMEALIGRDVVLDKRDELQRDAAAESVRQAIAQNTLRVAEAIGGRSIVVGVLADAAGQVQRPGRLQAPYADFLPALKEALVGKAVGLVHTSEDGSTFRVTEVYDPVETPQPGITPEDVQAAVEADRGEIIESGS